MLLAVFGLAVTRALLVCAFLLHSLLESREAWPDSRIDNDRFRLEDYFSLKEVAELTLSPNGKWLAFSIQSASGRFSSEPERSVYLLPTAKPHSVQSLGIPKDASQLVWVMGGSQLAYLSAANGSPQVYTYDPLLRTVQQRTAIPAGVSAFGYQPGGRKLALLVQTAQNHSGGSLRHTLEDARTGVLLDGDLSSAYDFVAGGEGVDLSQPKGQIWLQADSDTPTKLDIPNVQRFSWSDSGAMLSVVYIDKDDVPRLTKGPLTSVGIFDVHKGTFSQLAVATRHDARSPVRYEGGEWLSDNRRILLRRSVGERPWFDQCFLEWAVVRAVNSGQDETRTWRPGEVCNPMRDSLFHPVNASSVLVENTRRAVRSLYEWSERNAIQSSRLSSMAGSQSHFSFSADKTLMAFVAQRMDDPPEIYLQSEARNAPRKITGINEHVAQRTLPRVHEVSWRSADGELVTGLLLSPISDETQPWPLITYIHGGPGAAVVNEFAQWFAAWPYPFELYASSGMAVFFPNYRGTATFGRAFLAPSAIDKEPVADVLSGIQALVERGIADASKLAVSGHSHGAWLGALLLTRTEMFAAASFAEGWANTLVTYELMPGELNREVHDIVFNGNPYETPERYFELSPSLNFGRVSTPTLFESGAEGGALLNLAYAKAAKRFGVPSESIVYPRTGHVMTEAMLQHEAAERNLQWFEFWLLGHSRSESQYKDQYVRWERLKMAASAHVRNKKLLP